LRPRLLLTDREFEAVGRELSAQLGLLHLPRAEFEAALADAAPKATATAWPAERVWYLLYTSGTTGLPKAVIQTFGMALANYFNIGQAIDLGADEAGELLIRGPNVTPGYWNNQAATRAAFTADDELRAFCRKLLAAYKVPKHVEIVADFPRTAAGKVQKHVLRGRFLGPA